MVNIVDQSPSLPTSSFCVCFCDTGQRVKQYFLDSLAARVLAIVWILLSKITVKGFEVDGEKNAVYLLLLAWTRIALTGFLGGLWQGSNHPSSSMNHCRHKSWQVVGFLIMAHSWPYWCLLCPIYPIFFFFFLKLYPFIFMCANALSPCVSMYHVLAWCP